MTSPLSQSVIFHLAGALNDREDDDGAVGNRDAHYIGGFNATWPPGAPADPHVAWARDGWERIRPFSTGGNYVNFQLADDDTARTADAYGTNYQRLQQVRPLRPRQPVPHEPAHLSGGLTADWSGLSEDRQSCRSPGCVPASKSWRQRRTRPNDLGTGDPCVSVGAGASLPSHRTGAIAQLGHGRERDEDGAPNQEGW